MRQYNLAFGCLLLLSIGLYALGLPGAFLLDDNINILPAQISTLSLDELLIVASSNTSGPLGRPISVISFALANYVFSVDPIVHKIINIILHLTVATLGYVFLKRLLKSLGQPEPLYNLIAFLTIAFWVIHPIHVSTVLYSVQRMTQLSTLFTLLGLLAYSHLRLKLTSHPITAYILLLLAYLVFTALGAFSKETGLLLPVFILLCELLCWRFSNTNPKALLSFILLFIVFPLLGAVAYSVYNFETLIQNYDTYAFNLDSRLLTEPSVLWFYCQLLILPRLRYFALFHDDFPLTSSMDETFFISISGWILIILSAFLARKKMPAFLLGISWFLAGHLLESTFLPLELVFEHRNYLPSFGILLIFSTFVVMLGKKLNLHSAINYGFILGIFALLSALTAIRAHTWSSESVFLNVAAIEHPDSARAQGEWGNHLAMQGDIEGAILALERSADLAKHNPGPVVHQLLLSCYIDKISELTIERVAVSLSQNPMTPYAVNSINNLMLTKLAGACPVLEPDLLVMLVQNAYQNAVTQRTPNWASLIGINLGRAYFVNQQFERAWDAYDEAFLFYPSRLETLIEKATLQATIADFASASKTLQDIEKLTKNRVVRYDVQLSDLKRLINESQN